MKMNRGNSTAEPQHTHMLPEWHSEWPVQRDGQCSGMASAAGWPVKRDGQCSGMASAGSGMASAGSGMASAAGWSVQRDGQWSGMASAAGWPVQAAGCGQPEHFSGRWSCQKRHKYILHLFVTIWTISGKLFFLHSRIGQEGMILE